MMPHEGEGKQRGGCRNFLTLGSVKEALAFGITSIFFGGKNE